MERFKRHWYSIPTAIRKPVILIIGLLFVIASLLTGWLPGPGGLPLFLIGIAILSTEFAWAKRLRDRVVNWLQRIVAYYRQHRLLGTALLAILAAAVIGLSIAAYRFIYASA